MVDERRTQEAKPCNERLESLSLELREMEKHIYSQIESFLWLKDLMSLSGNLPPLRGWAASPDVLLLLHRHITQNHPSVVVELGSGASTLVIANALRKNGSGKVLSFDHDSDYSNKTLAAVKAEQLEAYVEMKTCPLTPWQHDHMKTDETVGFPRWYGITGLLDIDEIDLLWVDGPPGNICRYSRYPAMPFFMSKLSARAEVWMDDTRREEEKAICKRWAKDYGWDLKYHSVEKGLGCLTHQQSVDERSKNLHSVSTENNIYSHLGLNFDLP